MKTIEEELFFDTWDKNVELHVILKIYLTYGVLRPSEIIEMQITDTDEGYHKINYINVQIKQRGRKVVDVIDDKLHDILCKGLNRYLVTTQNGELYASRSSFFKYV